MRAVVTTHPEGGWWNRIGEGVYASLDRLWLIERVQPGKWSVRFGPPLVLGRRGVGKEWTYRLYFKPAPTLAAAKKLAYRISTVLAVELALECGP